ncbi:MAG TPA: CDP-alcohol phosphatidyltransferase family protein [Terriglobales bacterium]|nr:CDP-alcohol phosphatidyltransferase family protein [Terriglobales bacterium]
MASKANDIEVPFNDMGGGATEQFSQKELTLMEFQNAERVQQTIVTGAEKKLLRWLAARMPAWVSSDQLTLLGFVAQFFVGLSYALAAYDNRGLIAATGFLALNWFGDSLDGTIARFRNRQRPRYGFYVDHIIDSFGAVFLCGGLAFSTYMTPMVAMVLLTAFLMLSIETYLATYCLGKFNLGHFLFGPTEIRILLAIGNVALLWKPHVHFVGTFYPLFDIGGVIASVGMFFMLVTSAIRHTVVLYREERL